MPGGEGFVVVGGDGDGVEGVDGGLDGWGVVVGDGPAGAVPCHPCVTGRDVAEPVTVACGHEVGVVAVGEVAAAGIFNR